MDSAELDQVFKPLMGAIAQRIAADERAAQAAAWPEGVVARYLNLAGATVDVYADRFACTGCPDGHTGVTPRVIHEWARSHAETCRAIRRPTV